MRFMASFLGSSDVVMVFVASLLPCRRTCAHDGGRESQGNALGLDEGQGNLNVLIVERACKLSIPWTSQLISGCGCAATRALGRVRTPHRKERNNYETHHSDGSCA